MTNVIVSCDKLNAETELAIRVAALKQEIAGLSDEKKLVDQFVTAMGSGKASSKHLATIFIRVIGNKNDGFDVNLISQACNRLDKAGDAQGVTTIKRIYGAIFVGGKVSINKDKSGIAFKSKGSVVDVTALDRLIAAQFSGLSIRSTLVSRVLNTEKAEPKPVDERIESLAALCVKDGMSDAHAMAKFEASLKASRLERANKAALAKK